MREFRPIVLPQALLVQRSETQRRKGSSIGAQLVGRDVTRARPSFVTGRPFPGTSTYPRPFSDLARVEAEMDERLAARHYRAGMNGKDYPRIRAARLSGGPSVRDGGEL